MPVRQGLKFPGYIATPSKLGFSDGLSPVYRALFVAQRFIAGRIPSPNYNGHLPKDGQLVIHLDLATSTTNQFLARKK